VQADVEPRALLIKPMVAPKIINYALRKSQLRVNNSSVGQPVLDRAVIVDAGNPNAAGLNGADRRKRIPVDRRRQNGTPIFFGVW
jgi:hypothetical protein